MSRFLYERTLRRVTTRLTPSTLDRTSDLRQFLEAAAASRARFSILQIGAYDGLSNDPVHDLIRNVAHVDAVLLEPQDGPYATLARRWTGIPRVTTRHAALADRSGERQLYMIAQRHKHRHPFPEQVASFYRWRVEDAVNRYMWRPPPDVITGRPVTTTTWADLVADHGPFDLVAIDAEGYDAEILGLIDLGPAGPDLLLYEHSLMSSRVRRRCEESLGDRGFSVSRVTKADTLATRGGFAWR